MLFTILPVAAIQCSSISKRLTGAEITMVTYDAGFRALALVMGISIQGNKLVSWATAAVYGVCNRIILDKSIIIIIIRRRRIRIITTRTIIIIGLFSC